MIEATDIIRSFPGDTGAVRVLDGVSLSVAAGETLALTGESGSGKSTLLHILGALDTPDSGTLRIGDTDVAPLGDDARAALRRDRIGLVFQQFNLIPSLPLMANIAFQARLAGRHDAEWCAHLTDRLGLSGLAHRYPEELSGGQQQRVAIGRALAPRPDVILADEPTGNLDEDSADRVLSLMLELVTETGAGLLMVTHSARVAARLSRRVHLTRGRILPEGAA